MFSMDDRKILQTFAISYFRHETKIKMDEILKRHYSLFRTSGTTFYNFLAVSRITGVIEKTGQKKEFLFSSSAFEKLVRTAKNTDARFWGDFIRWAEFYGANEIEGKKWRDGLNAL